MLSITWERGRHELNRPLQQNVHLPRQKYPASFWCWQCVRRASCLRSGSRWASRAPSAGPRWPWGPWVTRSLIPPPECAPDRQGSGEQEPFQGFPCKRSAAGVELLFPLSLSLFLFSCLAFANPQAAVFLSKEALMGGGPGKISPTDECNLDRKYVFYQRPHVANSN